MDLEIVVVPSAFSMLISIMFCYVLEPSLWPKRWHVDKVGVILMGSLALPWWSKG